MTEIIKNIAGRMLLDVLPRMIYRIDGPEDDRLEIIRSLLAQRSDLSYVLYFNHISYNDPLLAVHIARRIDNNRHLVAPASYSHTDKDGPQANSALRFMADVASNCGIEVVRIIQNYQINDPKYGYTEAGAMVTYRAWLTKLRNLHKQDISVGCLMSPEGHRSESGTLGKGEKGITNTGALLAPVAFIPLGIVYEGKYERDGVNIGRRVSLFLGESVTQENRSERVRLNRLMLNLANILPVSMRGQWTEAD